MERIEYVEDEREFTLEELDHDSSKFPSETLEEFAHFMRDDLREQDLAKFSVLVRESTVVVKITGEPGAVAGLLSTNLQAWRDYA